MQRVIVIEDEVGVREDVTDALEEAGYAVTTASLDAARSGVHAVHIIDGRVPHAMLLEILTDQAYGTMIRSH